MAPSSQSRRQFVKSAGLVGIGVGVGSAAAAPATERKPAIRNFRQTMSYRQVGTTGIHVSALTIGTTKADPGILAKAMDAGINFIHTGTRYSGGNAITTVAQAIKGKTGLVHLAVKDDFPSVEEALRILGVNQVDFVMFNRHWAEGFQKEIPEIQKKFDDWRTRGLVKFAGLTTHGEMAACIDIALNAGFFSCVMPTYSPTTVETLAPQRDKCREKKVSIIAMKTKGELPEENYPAQIGTVLSDTAVCTVCRTVGSYESLDAWAKAAAQAKTGFLRRRSSGRYAQAPDYRGCGLCGKCREACPLGIAASDAVRCIRYYHDAEASPEVAARTFRELRLAGSLAHCTRCGVCDGACPQGIGVMNEIARAQRVLQGIG